MDCAQASARALPIIDLRPFLMGEPGSVERTAAQLGDACRKVGFFYLTGHGIGQNLLDEVFALSRTLFAQEPGVKDALSIARSMNNRGYVALDSENLDPDAPSDAKEAFNIGREPDPGEPDATGELPSTGVNFWPDIPRFRTVMNAYYQACRSLCEQLHEVFAADLGLAADYFAPYVDHPSATLRLLHYPANPRAVDERLGAGEHTDYGNVTILAQDDVGGLEVRNRDGEWLKAAPIAGAFIVNIGDCLMRWSNDIYLSTPHRVVSPLERERYSVAFFFDPNPDALIETLPGCLRPGEEVHYEPVLFSDYLRARLDATYAFRAIASDGNPKSSSG